MRAPISVATAPAQRSAEMIMIAIIEGAMTPPSRSMAAASDIPALDFDRQLLHHVGDIFEVRIDLERVAIGLERVLVVANFLQDDAQARQRAEMARFAFKHLADIGDGVAVIVFQIIDGGTLVPALDIVGPD